MSRTAKRLASSLAALLASAALVQPAAAQGFWDRLLGRTPQQQPGAVILPGGVVNTGAYVLDRRDNLPVARNNVVVFVGGGCPQCPGAVEDAKTVAVAGVEVLDVSAGGMARDTFHALGLNAIPATVAGSQMVVGRDINLARAVAARAGMDARPNTGN